jgi:hypothetical protein
LRNGSETGSFEFLLWDRKRQVIWLIGGLIIGTYVAYSDSFTDDNEFSVRFFVFMESLVLVIMAGLFYFYSRRN